MKTYFKTLFLLLFVFSCTPEEVQLTYSLNYQVFPENTGTVASVVQGDNVQLTAIPVENYIFKGWLLNDESTEYELTNPLFVYLDTNKSIRAFFEKKDTDGDGVTDDVDLCMDTPEGEVVDNNGCSESEKDADNDGVMNDEDTCPDTLDGESVDENGCADYQKDTDEDGVMDNLDLCRGTQRDVEVDENGCADYQKDTDDDGVTDNLDLCPETLFGSSVDGNGCADYQKGIEGINFMNGMLSGGLADVIEIAEGNNADIYEELSANPDCDDSWFPRGSLCDQAPYVNDPDFSFRNNNDAGATWGIDDFNDYGILVIDLGSEQFINSMSVFQMMDSDGKTSHIEAYAYPNATAVPLSSDANWTQLFPYTEVGEGTFDGDNTVSDPLKVNFNLVQTRYIMLYLKNDGSLGDEDYIELRQVKAFFVN